MKYPQPHSLRKYYDDIVVDRVHHAIKKTKVGDILKKYQVYLRPLPRRNNRHKTRQY